MRRFPMGLNDNISEERMKKTIIATTIALALSTTLAAAQSSQGQAGANTGPTSNSAVNQNNGTTANEMNRDGKADRGMTTGSGTGMSGSGNANSMGGTNSSANPNNSAGAGSGSAGMK
jgi:hypothetical protein